MIWVDRIIGVAAAILITASLLLVAAYGAYVLLTAFRQTSPQRVLVLLHSAICIFLAWQLVRAYRTGSIKRRRLPPIARQERPFAFWAWVSSYVLLILMLGPLWALTRIFGPI